MSRKLAIIGAGQAGFAVAAKLRALGSDDEIVLIGEEASPPYQRPPLSKAFLKGELEEDRLWFRPASFFRDHAIDFRPATRAAGVDRVDRRVILDDGEVPYDQLVIATGSAPRRLPAEAGGDFPNVHSLRSIEDARHLGRALKLARTVLIVGGGYVGLEVAAVAAAYGKQVCLLEASERILQRVASPETSDYFRAMHRERGVDIRESTGVARMEGRDAAERAVLSDGSTLPCDLVLVGIGAMANDGLARAAGLACDNGIVVDARGRTSDPAIWAAGDVCTFPFKGRRTRLESVQNAVDQGEVIAANLMGGDLDYAPVPWFWSDQYDVKLQIVGLTQGYDRAVRREGRTEGSQSVWYFSGERFLGLEAMNEPRSYMIGRKLLDKGICPPPEAVADAAFDLRGLL